MGTISMVTMAQSAANWRNTHTHMDRMHSLTQLHEQLCSHEHYINWSCCCFHVPSSCNVAA